MQSRVGRAVTCCKDAGPLQLSRPAGYQLLRASNALLKVCAVLIA